MNEIGMVQISSCGYLPLLIWTRNFRLGQETGSPSADLIAGMHND